MRKNLVVGLLLGLILAAAGSPLRAQPQTPQPNLLLITADDLNGDSMGWMGSKVGATPNIDAFAATCQRLEQCHVSVPICQPSRSAFMTGRVPHRNGALGFDPVNGDVPTLVEVLAARGYFTAAINKIVHMTPERKFNWDLSRDGSGKNPKALRADVEQAIKAAREKGRPFFLNANITDPHRPFAGGGQGKGQDQGIKAFSDADVVVPAFLEDIPLVRKEVAQYFTSVRRMDQSFGEILAALQASGQADNTVVVFFSDHGMSFPFSKATLYRSGTWTPLLLRWPGMAKPAAVKDDMVSSVDIMPTVLDLLQVAPPAGMDGRSFLPLLRGEKQPDRGHVFTHVNTVNSGKSFAGRCVRSKTRAYIWNAWPDGTTRFQVEAMAGLSSKAMAEAGASDPKIEGRMRQFLLRSPEEFYDLEKDPGERRNLINDPAYQPEIERLRRQLLAHMQKTGDPQLPVFQKIVKP